MQSVEALGQVAILGQALGHMVHERHLVQVEVSLGAGLVEQCAKAVVELGVGGRTSTQRLGEPGEERVADRRHETIAW